MPLLISGKKGRDRLRHVLATLQAAKAFHGFKDGRRRSIAVLP
jgi:hypothetical protein